MKITGEHTIAAPRQAVWEALLDPTVLANTLPGCEDLKQTAENRFEGKLTMKVGPVQGIFQGRVELSDLHPPQSYRLTLDGKGAPGFVNGKGSLKLEESDGKTVLHYEVDAQVGGRIAGVGQRLLDSSAKVITRQALEGLEQQILERQRATGEGGADATAGGGAEATGAASPSATPPPSQAKFMASFIGGLIGELVPKEHRPLATMSLLGLILVVVAVILRGCGS